MKNYRTSICMILIIALALGSFFVLAKTVQDTNVSSAVSVTFETDGGQAVPRLNIEAGTALTPVVPTKDGYSFDGWYTSPDFAAPFSSGSKLFSGITLYAKWVPLAETSNVTFGAYPQQRVTDSDTLANLNLLSPMDGFYEYNSKKYVAYEIADKGSALENDYLLNEIVYFEVAPITWQILKTVGDNHILITKDIIECAPYHAAEEQITYAASDIRQLLNNEFYNLAFNSLQKSQIVTSALTNPDNSDYHTEGGADTSDEVYILSVDEAKNGAYFAEDQSRKAFGSDFAKAKGLNINPNANLFGLSRWWLRSAGDYYLDAELGIDFNNAASVDSGGYLTNIGTRITSESVGIRPVICVPVSIFSAI